MLQWLVYQIFSSGFLWVLFLTLLYKISTFQLYQKFTRGILL